MALMAPKPFSASLGGRIEEPMFAKDRRPLLNFALQPTSYVVSSAIVLILILLIFYPLPLSLGRCNSSRSLIGHRRRRSRDLLDRHLGREEDTIGLDAKPRISGLDDDDDNGLTRESNNTKAPIDIVYQHTLPPSSYSSKMASSREQRHDKEEHNPLRPKVIKPTPHSGPSATIALAQGRYTGVLLAPSPLTFPRAVEAWRGIPYAQATGGRNRFRPPAPLGPGPDRCFSADSFGRACPGSTGAAAPSLDDGNGAGDPEDCLNLNVYRPAPYSPARDGALPVVVYLHGGAFNAGLGAERDMASFVGWSEAPILGVSFNYRVGALGFPSSGAAEAEGALNLGLRDQRFLFEWVRDNIGGFGGDRERVTLMGMSAGAHSVSLRLRLGWAVEGM